MMMKAVTVPNRSPCAFTPSDMGMVVQEQPGRRAPARLA